MDNLRRSVILAVAAVVGVGGAVTVAQEDIEPLRVPPPAPQTLSGQEVFRAVVFSQGPLAKQLADQPSLKNFYGASYAVSNDSKQLAAVDKVIKRISVEDPSYFTRFTGAVRSGNPYIVSDALDGVESELQKVGFSSSEIVDPFRAGNVNVNTSFTQNMHTTVNIALTENIAVNTNLMWPRPASSSGTLPREIAVGRITETLRA